MPHCYRFDPPIRGKKGGPMLRFRKQLADPSLEASLDSTRLGRALTPYRKNADVENLLDAMTQGIPMHDLDQCILMLACGISQSVGGVSFKRSPGHIHNTEENMTPDVLLEHSKDESGTIVSVQAIDELSLLVVALTREMGYKSYLSTVETPERVPVSGVSIVHDSEVNNFVIDGQHPHVSKLTIFEDPEVVLLLSLLKTHNLVGKLKKDLETGITRDEGQYRYSSLLRDFAFGSVSGHHLSNIVGDELEQLLLRYPGLSVIPKA